MRRQPKLQASQTLAPAITLKLLYGGLQAPGGADLLAAGDPFIVFDIDDWGALWRQHRGELLKLWKARGETGVPWGARFDGEDR
jgi:hypothetical protein